MKSQADIYRAALATQRASTLTYTIVRYAGEKHEVTVADQRFETRRLFNKEFLIDRRIRNRRM
jgi:hypothetical protein